MEKGERTSAKVFGTILRKIMHISPLFCIESILLALLKAGERLSWILFPALLLEEMTTSHRVDQIILWGGLCIGVPAIFAMVNAFLSNALENLARYVEDELEASIDQVNMQTRYADFDSPEIHAIFQEIKDGQNMVGSVTGVIRNHILAITQHGFTLVLYVPLVFQLVMTDGALKGIEGAAAWICRNTPLFLVFIIILCGVTVALRYQLQQKAFHLVENFSGVEREYQYYVGIRSDYENGADIRLNGLGEMLGRRMEKYNQEERRMHLSQSAFQGRADFLLCVFKAMQTMAIYGFILGKALWGAIGISGFYLYTSVLSQALTAMTEILRQCGELKNAGKYYKGYLQLWERQTETGNRELEQAPILACGDIVFEDVSFRYPGTQQWILKKINLTIRAGEKLAIVGRNGAGKTTLVKVLMGLYPVEFGHIYIDGRDVNTLNSQERFDAFSTVFQDYRLLAASLQDNVTAFEKDPDTERVLRALKDAGFEVKGEEELYRPVSRHLSDEGILFSGGEEQKIAIARALYKDAPYYIMDEPSAALDPIAEKEINERMLRATEGHTLLIISHRLSTCTRVDRVVVLDEGEILEEGSHQALLKRGGLYSQMWEAQARHYR